MEIRISIPTDGKGGIEIRIEGIDEEQNIKVLEQRYISAAAMPEPKTEEKPRWDEDHTVCPCCGKQLFNSQTGRKKRFCSNECRRKWWSKNRDKVNKSPGVEKEITCLCCGRQFLSYGNPKRKYCSRECYINARFWGGTQFDNEGKDSPTAMPDENELVL